MTVLFEHIEKVVQFNALGLAGAVPAPDGTEE